MSRKKFILLVISLGLIFGVFSCKKSNEFNPSASYLGRSDCGNVWKGTNVDQRVLNLTKNTVYEIVQYSFQDNVLEISHINAGFNCCPEIAADIDVSGDVILIEEKEIKGECSCLCLYTLKYKIEDLKPGLYKIKISCPYIPNGEQPVELEIELFQGASGRVEFVRNSYPWI
jgi:hypothetical protein